MPEAVAALGRLDVCVASAGIWPAADVPLWEMPLERWEETLAANLRVTFLTARAFLRHAADDPLRRPGPGGVHRRDLRRGRARRLRRGQGGHPERPAAQPEERGGPHRGAGECGGPGWTLTPMIGAKGLDEARLARITATMALKKIARPEDIAPQVVALASDTLSGHVTGQVVVVAGGMEGRIVD